MKVLKMILLTAIIVVPLYIFIVNPLFETFQPTSKTVQENNYEDDYVETIEDQEVHIDGFPVIYIEGDNKIEKEHWECFLADLQNECNIPWLTKMYPQFIFARMKFTLIFIVIILKMRDSFLTKTTQFIFMKVEVYSTNVQSFTNSVMPMITHMVLPLVTTTFLYYPLIKKSLQTRK